MTKNNQNQPKRESRQPDLSDFIKMDIALRKMSMTQYAKFVGVDRVTISNHVRGGRGGRGPLHRPSIEFVLALSRATGYHLQHLLALAYPDFAEAVAVTPRAALLALRFESLPQSLQDAVFRIAFGEQVQGEGE